MAHVIISSPDDALWLQISHKARGYKNHRHPHATRIIVSFLEVWAKISPSSFSRMLSSQNQISEDMIMQLYAKHPRTYKKVLTQWSKDNA